MDIQVVNCIKSLGIDMIKEASSGHPGIVLGAANIMYSIYANHLMFNKNDENWINRDRFVMSSGHGSALLYATLYMAGILNIDDLKQFRQLNSKTPGHPEYKITPFVEVSTGPLGQGIANAVGMALGAKINGDKYILEKKDGLFNSSVDRLIDYKVYVLCGDGDLMEGISYEAASFAGTHKLNNLIVLYDSNKISLDGSTDMTFTENTRSRFESMGWNTILVNDGNNLSEIDKAINEAKNSSKPTFIEVRTIIGYGSSLAGTNEVHGKVLSNDDMYKLKESFGMKNEPFMIIPNLDKWLQNKIADRIRDNYENWNRKYLKYKNEINTKFVEESNYLFKKYSEYNINNVDWVFNEDEEMRNINKRMMDKISNDIPYFITGSADLFSSCKNYIGKDSDIKPDNYNKKNIWFGVREHAMGAILNGLSLTGFRVSGSTFLSFADYLKPTIRLAAMMNLPVTHIFTHDSITIGSDGPTHQPIEQLAMLRTIPNNFVYRPCDGNELIGCWNNILNQQTHPSSLVISKNVSPLLEGSKSEQVNKGAYIIRKENNELHGIIIATGKEVETALKIANSLYIESKIDIRVISMPCMEIFLKQPIEYRNELLPLGKKVFVIEYGSSALWHQFVYSEKYLFTINEFGASAGSNDLLKEYNLDYKSIREGIKTLLL